MTSKSAGFGNPWPIQASLNIFLPASNSDKLRNFLKHHALYLRTKTTWMRKLILLAIVIISHVTRAQQVNLEQHFKNWQPRCIGPSGMSGRITAIDALIENPNVIILGAASGGVWRTENGGADWTPIFDDQPILNIGAVAIQQSNPSVIWVGTGEGNPRNSINIGEGMYKTLDGGKTWKRMGLEKTRNIHRVFIHPDNPDVVYAGAIGNPYA